MNQNWEELVTKYRIGYLQQNNDPYKKKIYQIENSILIGVCRW